jgi:hypothetical protein
VIVAVRETPGCSVMVPSALTVSPVLSLKT